MNSRMFSIGMSFSIILCLSGCQAPESVPATAETKETEPAQEPMEPYEDYENLIAAARECVVKNNGEKPDGYDFSSVIYMKKDWDYGT